MRAAARATNGEGFGAASALDPGWRPQRRAICSYSPCRYAAIRTRCMKWWSSWSSGQIQGQLDRRQLVRRTMCGRASVPLLRRRVLVEYVADRNAYEDRT